MKKINIILESRHHRRKFSADIRFLADGTRKPVLIFVHGFKGFKDWGCFDAVADFFARSGFVFAKFNFSHNGTTPDNPLDFVDLEAFGNNNFTIELNDLRVFTDFIFDETNEVHRTDFDLDKVGIIGFSRGAAVAMIAASEDKRLKAVASWAGMSDLTAFVKSEEMAREWKEKGVYYVINGRTKQEMPLYYQLYEDTVLNAERFSVKNALAKSNLPLLILHGDSDETLPLGMAKMLREWSKNSEFHIIAGANHAFGGSHPYPSTELPEKFLQVAEITESFMKKHLR